MLEAGDFTNDKLMAQLESEEILSEATGILQNSAPDINTAEKRMGMLKDLIISVMERKCEMLSSGDDPENEMKVFTTRLEIDKLKSGKLRMSDEEES